MRHGAFLQGLQRSGLDRWPERADRYRWAAGDAGRIRSAAAELVALGPDVIFSSGFSPFGRCLNATRTSRSCLRRRRPGRRRLRRELGPARRQCHRLRHYEFGFADQVAGAAQADRAGVTRAAVLRDPTISAGIGQFAAIQGAAPSLGVELTPIDVRDGEELSAPSPDSCVGRMTV